MIITESEGLNLNSPIVQNMIKDWPAKRLATTKFHYGTQPMKETVSTPFLSNYSQEESDVSYGMMPQNQSPYTMSVNNSYGNMLPQVSFGGALSQPSYFDFNQPGGYVPPSTGSQYGFGSVRSTPLPPVSQMQATGNFGYNPMPSHFQQPGFNEFYRNCNNNTPENIIRTPEPPRSVIMAGPGTVYSNVEHRMYADVQPNHYNPLPSNEFVEKLVHRASNFDRYSNPYMANMGMGINWPNMTRDDAYRMARHNYAMQFGYTSLEEMEQADMACLKTLSIIANKYMGMADEDVKDHIKKVYEDPYKPKPKPTLAERTKSIEAYQKHLDSFKVNIHVSIVKGDTVVREYNPKTQAKPYFDNEDCTDVFIRHEQNIAQRDYNNAVMHSNAMERKYDNFSIVQYFNEAFYDLHFRDTEAEFRSKNNALVKNLYSHEDFKREIMAKFGRPAQRARLAEEDMRFRKHEPLPEGYIRGGYGKLPLGVPMESGSDPRMGYCSYRDVETGKIGFDMPLSDRQLMERKNKFLLAAGCEVPLYAPSK